MLVSYINSLVQKGGANAEREIESLKARLEELEEQLASVDTEQLMKLTFVAGENDFEVKECIICMEYDIDDEVSGISCINLDPTADRHHICFTECISSLLTESSKHIIFFIFI